MWTNYPSKLNCSYYPWMASCRPELFMPFTVLHHHQPIPYHQRLSLSFQLLYMLPYSSSRSKLYRKRRKKQTLLLLLFSFLFPLSSVWSNVASSFSSLDNRHLWCTVCLAATTTITLHFCFSKAYHSYFHYYQVSSRLQIRLWSSSRRRRRKASPEFSCYKRAYFWRLISHSVQFTSWQVCSQNSLNLVLAHTNFLFGIFLLRTLLSKSHLSLSIDSDCQHQETSKGHQKLSSNNQQKAPIGKKSVYCR